MNIMIGDTIVTDDREIGIVENRAGEWLIVRFPDSGNRREQVRRTQAKPLAKLAYLARLDGKPLPVGTKISLVGKSTLADLVALFGYSTGQMRRESLSRVRRQLERAGLDISSETDRWNRDDRFKISMLSDARADEDDEIDDPIERALPTNRATPTVDLPDPFWPTALGLDRGRELDFLRALTDAEPILCLLHVPANSAVEGWIQGTWEGILGWAFRAAQRFLWSTDNSSNDRQVRFGPAALLHTYIKPSVLDERALALEDNAHSLNLITIKNERELPTDVSRLRGLAGCIFRIQARLPGCTV